MPLPVEITRWIRRAGSEGQPTLMTFTPSH
jgi:hypothetical protein